MPGVESLTAEQARAQGYRAPASPVTLYIAPAGAADPRRYWYQSEAPEGEVAALRDLAKAVRAFVDSDDQDRIAEFDAMAAALACVGKEP